MKFHRPLGLSAVLLLAFFSYSCASASNNQDSLEDKEEKNKDSANFNTTISSLGDTDNRQSKATNNLYRHLVGVSNYFPSARAVQELCVYSQGFHTNLPRGRVLTSREIRIPVSHLEIRHEPREVQRYKVKVTEEDEVIYGVVVGTIKKEERIPYKETIVQEIRDRTSGVCVGSEYILLEE